MSLNPRLQTIYEMIKPCESLADIGCDHALLPIALVQGNKVNKVYACDINELPLKRGKQAIDQAKLADYIECILCDGIPTLDSNLDTLVIAGMGFETIKHILSNNLEVVRKCSQVILQSNQHVDDLRLWLTANHFKIDNEGLVKDGKHYYQILSISDGEMKLNDKEVLMGIYLDKHPLFEAYWQQQLAKRELIFTKLEPHHESYFKIKNEIELIKSYI